MAAPPPHSVAQRLGARVAQHREQLQMTQDTLANHLGYSSRAGISRLEHGHYRSMPFEVLRKLCEVLEVSADYLLGLGDQEQGERSGPTRWVGMTSRRQAVRHPR